MHQKRLMFPKKTGHCAHKENMKKYTFQTQVRHLVNFGRQSKRNTRIKLIKKELKK